MEIPAKEGMLHLQGVKFGKKSWRRIWAMLFAPSSYGIGRVELYNMRDGGAGGAVPAPARQGKGADKRVIRLDDCLSVCTVAEEDCPRDCSAFYLSTAQRTYALAAPPTDDWVSIISQLAFQRNNRKLSLNSTGSEAVQMLDNELYSSWSSGVYQVIVQRTEAAVRCNLAGSYLLLPSTEALTLQDPKTASPLYCWPYRLLRRFGNDKDKVSIEAGRRCDSGEGHFTFQSQHAAKIYKAIEEGIRQQSITDPKSSARTVPACIPASCSKVPFDDRDAASSSVHHNTNQWMEGASRYEVEEDGVCQEVGEKLDSPSPESLYSLLSYNQGMGRPTVGRPSPQSPTSSVVSSTEDPNDFRQKLSKLLSKDAAKAQPLVNPHQEY